MYAIVEIAGQQFKVAKDQKLFVNRLQDKEGSKVSFDKVYLLDDGKKVTVGAPAISGAAIVAKVVGHLKGDKVIVFKNKSAPAKKAPAKVKKVDYSKMTVAKLKAAAKHKGISGYTSLKKAELIAALNK